MIALQPIARTAHVATAWLLAASVVVQAFLAGSALINLGGNGDFSAHVDFGYTVIGLITLAVLITALVARLDRRQVGLSFALLVLYVVQTALPNFKADVPSLAALHPANAMLLFVLAILVARRAMRPAAADAVR